MKGTTASASLTAKGSPGAQAMLGFVFNAAAVDGNFGLLASGGAASFDDVRVKTDDPAFANSSTASMVGSSADSDGTTGGVLTQAELDSVAAVVISQWTDALGDGDARLAALADVRFGIADLPDGELGRTEGGAILVDSDAAGIGWYVDVSPAESSEFRVRLDRNVLGATSDSAAYGAFDLVTVLAHELGHVLGLDHHGGRYAVMEEALNPGTRYEVAALSSPASASPSPKATPTFELDAGTTAVASGASIDWQANAAGSWEMQLSPYAPPKPPQSGSSTLGDFMPKLVKGPSGPQEGAFDSLGRALLGKGKPQR